MRFWYCYILDILNVHWWMVPLFTPHSSCIAKKTNICNWGTGIVDVFPLNGIFITLFVLSNCFFLLVPTTVAVFACAKFLLSVPIFLFTWTLNKVIRSWPVYAHQAFNHNKPFLTCRECLIFWKYQKTKKKKLCVIKSAELLTCGGE